MQWRRTSESGKREGRYNNQQEKTPLICQTLMVIPTQSKFIQWLKERPQINIRKLLVAFEKNENRTLQGRTIENLSPPPFNTIPIPITRNRRDFLIYMTQAEVIQRMKSKIVLLCWKTLAQKSKLMICSWVNPMKCLGVMSYSCQLVVLTQLYVDTVHHVFLVRTSHNPSHLASNTKIMDSWQGLGLGCCICKQNTLYFLNIGCFSGGSYSWQHNRELHKESLMIAVIYYANAACHGNIASRSLLYLH